jgi:hypothetical protein
MVMRTLGYRFFSGKVDSKSSPPTALITEEIIAILSYQRNAPRQEKAVDDWL